MQILLGYNELGERERERKNEKKDRNSSICYYYYTRSVRLVCVSVCVRMPFTGEWSSSIYRWRKEEKGWWENSIYLPTNSLYCLSAYHQHLLLLLLLIPYSKTGAAWAVECWTRWNCIHLLPAYVGVCNCVYTYERVHAGAAFLCARHEEGISGTAVQSTGRRIVQETEGRW